MSYRPKNRKQLRATLWNAQMERQGFVRCYVCGGVIPEITRATLEHIKPHSRGGETALHNLSLSHHGCNSRRGNPDVD